MSFIQSQFWLIGEWSIASVNPGFRFVYTCNFCCDFLLLMDVKEWISYECSDEGIHILRAFITHLLVHMHQKEKIALEITGENAGL